ncbi:MAG: ParA family protein [Rhodanobacteraceae bacterium]
MLRVLVASSKGGCGKTTIATNLAAHYALAGKKTVLVDADRQGSSQRWCEKRAAGVAPAVLPLSGLRRDWHRHVPEDSERVIIDSAAGVRANDVADYLDHVDAILVPILPSTIDLEAAQPFLAEVTRLPGIKRGKVAIGLIANRLKPWTNVSQQALAEMRAHAIPIEAELRDTQGYVLASALGKSIFDYGSELVRSHQADWSKLLRWLKRFR